MNRLKHWVIRRFLWTILSRPVVRAINWDKGERDAFNLFCTSSCGIRLFEFLRQVVASKTFNAVYRDSVSGNAEARGAQDVLALLHRLRVFPFEESAYGLEDEEQIDRGGSEQSDSQAWLGGRGAIG